VQDASLYLTMIGSDVIEDRRRGGRWLEEHL
jgi:galactofuranose transport system substrate-binding protein